MPTIKKKQTILTWIGGLTSFCVIVVAGTVAAAQTPSPALLVVNKRDSTLAIVDPRSGKVVGRVPTGDTPHEVAVSADGRLAFAANYGDQTPGNSISVIDLTTQKELHRVDLGPLRRPHGMVVVDGELYFTAEENKVIARYDPSSNKVDWLLGTGQNRTHMLLFSKERSTIFTANVDSDSISAIQHTLGRADWRETVIPVGKGPEGMDLSPDGKELWVAHSDEGSFSIINVDTRKVMQTVSVQTQHSNRLKFTPDGKLVLISDYGAGDLLILDAKTHREVKRIKVGGGPAGILIVPDGSRAYVADTEGDSLVAIDLQTQEMTGRVFPGGNPDGMAWVPGR